MTSNSFLKTRETGIAGCLELVTSPFSDARGLFSKMYQHSVFAQLNLEVEWKEQFVSISNKSVLRGMHFQVPPCQQAKVVFCMQGQAQDVVCDLRVGPPSYGMCKTILLSGAQTSGVYLPKGLAHGFLALEEQTIMLYNVSEQYSPEHDKGILWNSLGIQWMITDPIVSDRDKSFPSLQDFNSPFVYE